MKRDVNKQIISVRVDTADLERLKVITGRLRIRNSAFLRFAIKTAIARLSPLDDPAALGRDLIPTFAAVSDELVRHFELDRLRLEKIINGNLESCEKRVDGEDIALLATNSLSGNYRYLKLKELSDRPVDRESVDEALRNYLLDKYINQ